MANPLASANAPRRVTVTIRMEADMLKQLDCLAARTFHSRNGLITFIFRYALENYEKMEPR